MARWLGRETDPCIPRKMQIDEINPSLRHRFFERVAGPLPYRLRALPAQSI